MSSTNRGSVRKLDDLYETPEWLTESIIPELLSRIVRPQDCKVLEPACGKGLMVRVLNKYFHNITATDINSSPSVNFLNSNMPPKPTFDLIITNPPYIHAMEFIKKALEWRRTPESVVAMLLRLNFLGSRRRAVWLREHIPAVYVTPHRPSFINGKTDSTEYAWFIWQQPFEKTSELGILETENT